MLSPGHRFPKAMGWSAFQVVRAKRLIETPPWLTVLIHGFLILAGGVGGALYVVALVARYWVTPRSTILLDLAAAPAVLIPLLTVGFVLGSVWTLCVIIGVRWQFRRFEKKWGRRAPALDLDLDELEMRVNTEILEREQPKT